MLKKLDILVIKAFIGPFIATFFITLMVLLMQFFWLWIDDFVGKGVSVSILLEFIWYQSAVLVPLALPLSVLLSSIMTFGNMGESYELVAIKSAGLSLLRFMRPMFLITLLICGIAFAFSNNIIPVANLKSRTLLSDIVNSKPSFDIKEGVFYNKIKDFSIKIGKKVNDTLLKDIVIYEANGIQDNFIIASDGVMRPSPHKSYLDFILRNGWRYEERGVPPNTDYIRLGFKEYKRSLDISFLGLKERTPDSLNRNNANMLSMRQLNVSIDSMRKLRKQLDRNIRIQSSSSLKFAAFLDSNWKEHNVKLKVSRFDQLIPDSIKTIVHQKAADKLNAFRISNEIAISQYKDIDLNLIRHEIEWHRKITLSLACLVMFLIGAPLGSIIRKGGLGSPLIFAIVFFMLFYFSSTTGEKFSKEGSWSVVSGMWLSTFVLAPIGFFLIYKAMRDSQLFNKEFYYRFWKKMRRRDIG